MKKLIIMLSALLILTSCATTTKYVDNNGKTPLKDEIKEVIKDEADIDDKDKLDEKEVVETEVDVDADKETTSEPAPAETESPVVAKPNKPTTKPVKPAKPKPVEPAKPKPAEPVITWGEEIAYSVIGFSTENINDNSINKGESKVKRNGVVGQDKIITSIKYSNGKEVSRSEKIVRTIEPISEQILMGTYLAPPAPTPPSAVVTSGGQVQVMVDLINADRSSRGLNKLSISGGLARGAGVRAKELITSFSHTRPDGQAFHSVSEEAYGENIAYGYRTGASAHEGFMNSPGHKDNILNTRWNTVGIGMIVSGDGTTYWAVLFGE